MKSSHVRTRNDRFQQWLALLGNRQKRQKSGEFLVQGVRPITLAVEHGWTISTWLHDEGRALSGWARELLARVPVEAVAMAPDLLRELGEKDDDAPELLAVVRRPADDLGRIPVGPDFLGVVFDRPTSPGNVGTLVRSADAFGASGVIVTGHAADVYDPKAVRASTGSLFALPVVRVPSHAEVLAWLHGGAQGPPGAPVTIVGTDEHGPISPAPPCSWSATRPPGSAPPGVRPATTWCVSP